ncbi:MAG: thiamine phosphate synthase [Candidatus Gastranaerophilales bacterium]|nr:thiamine phosphate synthase [Candidatus Gastranaerophilales bacterium]
MDINKIKFKDRNIFFIVYDFDFLSEDEILNYIAFAIESGVNVVSFFQAEYSDFAFINICRKIQNLCAVYDVLFLINRRLDIAQIIEVDGVVLQKDDISIKEARHILPQTISVGLMIEEKYDEKKLVLDDVDFIISRFDISIKLPQIPVYIENKLAGKVVIFASKHKSKNELKKLLENLTLQNS